LCFRPIDERVVIELHVYRETAIEINFTDVTAVIFVMLNFCGNNEMGSLKGPVKILLVRVRVFLVRTGL